MPADLSTIYLWNSIVVDVDVLQVWKELGFTSYTGIRKCDTADFIIIQNKTL